MMPRASQLRKAHSLRVAVATVVFPAILLACGANLSKPIPWQSVNVGTTDSSLTLTYGLDSCQDLDRIEVAYSRSAVTVTVFAVPNKSACSGLRFVRTVDVPLRAALAGRAVKDGAPR